MRYVAAAMAAIGAVVWAVFVTLHVQEMLDRRSLEGVADPLIEWQFLIPLVGFVAVAVLLRAKRSGPAFAVAVIALVMVMIFATGLGGSEFRFGPD